MKKMKLKKGDLVMIITGKDRGKRATIEKVLPRERKIIVSGVNLAKHHLKPSRKNPHGGIMDKLAPIDSSNAVIICPRCSHPSRIGYKIVQPAKEGLKRIRICKKCQESVAQNV